MSVAAVEAANRAATIKVGNSFIICRVDMAVGKREIVAYPCNRDTISDSQITHALNNPSGDLYKYTGRIEYLDLSYCSKIAVLPDLRMLTKLKSFSVSNCENLEALTGLPNLLQVLNLSYCPRLLNFSDGLLPTSLQYIFCIECKSLTSFPALNEYSELVRVDFTLCSSLERLPSLPASLEVLLICGARRLGKIPDLSVMCPKLRWFKIDDRSDSSIYYEAFNKDGVRELLKAL
jgi:hypothetical protein